MRRGRTRDAARAGSLPGPVSEKYLQARALLSSFMVRTGSRADLDRAHALFTQRDRADPGLPRDGAGWALRSCSMRGTDSADRFT